MASGLTSPASDELELLRQQYDRLCELMTRAAESDPAAAERVLVELQSLSERILILQTARADMPDALLAPSHAPAFTAPETAEAQPPVAMPDLSTTPPVESQPAATDRTAAPASRPEGTPARIVAFRVTPSVGPRAAGDAAPMPASWRIDTPPPDLGQPDSGPAGHDNPAAPPAGLSAGAPGPAAAAPPVKTVAPTARQPASAEAPQKAPARPAAETPPPPRPKPTAASAPAQPPAPPAGPAAPAAPGGAGNATLFSSAIRQWLERHRNGSEESAAAAAPAEVARIAQPVEPPIQAPPRRQAPAVQDSGSGPDSSQAFSRVVAAVEQQAAQIERILELCAAHQLALERLEARLQAQSAAPLAPDPELGELRTAVEEQRQRITSLAKTIHNLAQWLAAQRAAPDR